MCESHAAATAKEKAKGGGAEMLDTVQLMSRLGGSNDQVNLMEMVKYLKESKLARKVSGFAEKTAEDLAKKGKVCFSVQGARLIQLRGGSRQRQDQYSGQARLDSRFSSGRVIPPVVDRCSGRWAHRPLYRESNQWRGYQAGRHAQIHAAEPGRTIQRGRRFCQMCDTGRRYDGTRKPKSWCEVDTPC